MKTLTILLCILFSGVFPLSASDWNIRHIEDVFISDEINEICVFDNIAYLATTYGLVKMNLGGQESVRKMICLK